MSKIPAAVNNIFRKVCVFQIKVTPHNTSHGCEKFTVIRVMEEPATEASKVGAHTDVEASKLGAHREAEASKTNAHTTTGREVQAAGNLNKSMKIA